MWCFRNKSMCWKVICIQCKRPTPPCPNFCIFMQLSETKFASDIPLLGWPLLLVTCVLLYPSVVLQSIPTLLSSLSLPSFLHSVETSSLPLLSSDTSPLSWVTSALYTCFLSLVSTLSQSSSRMTPAPLPLCVCSPRWPWNEALMIWRKLSGHRRERVRSMFPGENEVGEARHPGETEGNTTREGGSFSRGRLKVAPQMKQTRHGEFCRTYL